MALNSLPRQRTVANDSVSDIERDSITEMNTPEFDEFVAIDWSGANNKYTGIAVATCRPGSDEPRLVEAESGRWTRLAIAAWLNESLHSRKRLLVGLDFAFGFPFEDGCGYFGGTTNIDNIFALWAFIEDKSAADRDFGCSTFVSHPDRAHLFWIQSKQPPDWINRKRRTESACREVTRTHPDTLYKLVGPKQVGKASITGIRVLHHLRSCNENVAVWPFEPVCESALVEIYPTLFRMHATAGIEKIRTWSALNQALELLGCGPVRRRVERAPTDHETDALLSAAGLRAFANNPGLWFPPEIQSPRVRREGWIFGV